MEREISTFYSKLAKKMRQIMKNEPVRFIRTMRKFTLLRAINLCICGSISHYQSTVNTYELDLSLIKCESKCTNKNNYNFKIYMLIFRKVFANRYNLQQINMKGKTERLKPNFIYEQV